MLIALLASYFSNSLTREVKTEVETQIEIAQREIINFRKDISRVRDSALTSAKELQQNAYEIKLMSARVREEVIQVIKSSESAEKSIQKLGEKINVLTTDEISKKLKSSEIQISKLSGQLEALQVIIDPKKATEILNVARMQEEILARKDLEKSLNSKIEVFNNSQIQNSISVSDNIKAVSSRILNLESELRKLLYWIMGIFISIIVGFFALFGYLGKKITNNIQLSLPINVNAEV